jgi:hypothetical protein
MAAMEPDRQRNLTRTKRETEMRLALDACESYRQCALFRGQCTLGHQILSPAPFRAGNEEIARLWGVTRAMMSFDVRR